MWFRLLVVLAVAGPGVVMMASVSSREDNTEDGVVHLEPMPLILAAPSKVARANKLKENEVNNALSKLMTMLPSVVSTKVPSTTTTSPTTTTTESTKTTTETERDEVAETETESESTKAAATSTSQTLNPTLNEAENKSSDMDEDNLEQVAVTTAQAKIDIPSSTWGFFNINNDARSTEAEEVLRETDRDVLDEEVNLTTEASVDHNNASSTTESESASTLPTTSTPNGVVEHDYGVLIDTTKSQKVESADEEEEPVIVDRGLNIPPNSGDDLSTNEDAFVDEPIDLEVAEDRVDASETIDVEPEAEASEIVYSLANAPRTRALHGDDISVSTSDFVPSADRRSDDGIVEPDVRTSMTYSVAVLHPLGSFSEPSTLPHIRRSDPSDLTTADDVASVGRIEDDLPVEVDHTIANNATEEEDVTETAHAVATTATQTSIQETSTLPRGISKNLFYNKRFQPGKETETDKYNSEDKDLVPAESVQDSLAVADPLSSSPVDVTADQNAGGEDDYEYVYEYIDLNSTDIPDDLPEGAFIVTDDNTHIPITSLKTTTLPTTAEPKPVDEDPVDGTSASPSTLAGPRFPSFRDYPAGPTLSPDGHQEESVTSPSPTEFLLPHATSKQALPALASVTQASVASPSQLPFIPGMPDSPVYFVGIQREKITPDTAPLPSETPNEHNSLVSLYALSRALSLDDDKTESSLPSNETKPVQDVTVADTETANLTEASVKVPKIPAELPDPFDEEFLHGISQTPTQPLLTAAATEEAQSTATSPPAEPVEDTAVPVPAPAPKPRPGAHRQTGRPQRRQTTTTTTTTTTTQATTTALAEENTVAGNGRRPGSGRRPGVFSRRRSTTTTTSATDSLTSSVSTEAPVVSSARPRGVFSQRGRGSHRFPQNRNVQSTENDEKPAETEKQNDVGTETSTTSATTVASRPPWRRRRPTTSGSAAGVTQKPKTGEPTTPIPSANSASASESTTPPRRKIFASRGRSRLAPKLKPTDSPAGEEQADQHEASSDNTASSTEHPPKVEVTEKVASEGENGAAGAAADGNEGESEVEAEVATTTEEVSIGHRRFPPRKFRSRSNGNGPKSTPSAN